MADNVPDGYGNVRVSFGGSRNVTQGDKDNAAITVYFNGNQVEKNGNVFEDRVPIGTRLTITAEAVSSGRVIGKGEETITVESGTNDVQMKIYTYDNFVVTIDGKAEGFTNFTDAWDAASGKTATIKMNADASSVNVEFTGGNVTLDLNRHTLTGNGSDGVITVGNDTFYLTGKGTVKQPANASESVILIQGGTFNMQGGIITGGYGNGTGGGVYVSGTFNMYGGSIMGNRGSNANCGGGVCVMGGGSTFTMYGGDITNNTNTSNDSVGGGVYSEGTFIMKGGTISGNSSAKGGGVDINDETFNWEGGTISGNRATTSDGGNNVCIEAYNTPAYNLHGRDSLFRSVPDPQGNTSLVMD